MKYSIPILLAALVCSSCAHVAPNPSSAVFEFDLLQDRKLVTSVDIVLLKGWSRRAPRGEIIDSNVLVVGQEICDVQTNITNFTAWPYDDFATLFADFDAKHEYSDCFCSPRYVLAALFYVQTDETMDPFGSGIEKHNNRVAIALLDEAHDSVLVSDMKHGIRHFRFSVGHTPESRTPKLIGQIMNDLGFKYEFLKDTKGPNNTQEGIAEELGKPSE